MKGLSRTIIFLFLISGFIFPQKNIPYQDKKTKVPDKHSLALLNNLSYLNKSAEVSSLLDTLHYRNCTDLIYNFRFGGQDVILQWFLTSSDMTIKSIGINCWADSNVSVLVGLKIIKLSADSIFQLRDKQLGYYIVQENGKYSLSPFDDKQSDTINWVGKNIIDEPFEKSLPVSTDSFYLQLKVKNENTDEYQWLPVTIMGLELVVSAGDIVAVTIKNDSAVDDSVIVYSKIGCSEKKYGWKYYANGRYSANGLTDSAGIGWWAREYTFDVALAVEWPCDMLPNILISHLDGTLSTEPREVIAQVNVGCGSDTVTQVILQYKLNDSDAWLEVPMQHDSADIWKGMIPGQPANTIVTYCVRSITSDNHIYTSAFEGRYLVFGPTPNVNTLLVFNGIYFFSFEKEYPQDYYFGISDFINYNVRDFKHDVWGYGPLSDELVNHYDNILEITTPAPNDYNDSVIVKWLNSAPDHNYFLAGQEWLGHRYSYTDTTFLSGSFEYDILGITQSYNDVSYANGTGQNLPSRVFPVQTSLLFGDLYNLHNSLTPGDSLNYDPFYELGTNYYNWIDGYKVDTNRVEVDMYVETCGIGGQPHIELLPCASHLALPAGNKIAFFAFDPLALNANPTNQNYYWYGFSKESPQNKVLDWFKKLTFVGEEIVSTPQWFELYQNYPNPFNPVTKIKYSIPSTINHQTSNITLKVFDVLGREVGRLVNKEQPAGNYEVEWDAGSISSGIYFYELRAGSFVSNKKMILLK